LGLYHCNSCTEGNYNSLAPIQLFIGDKIFEMPVDSYIKRIDDEKCQLLLHPYETDFGNESKWVMGAEFLNKYYSIFDIENNRIGLIEAKL
jgi:hypothetical protein